MPLTISGIHAFLRNVATLNSFPLFCCYIAMILLAGMWQKHTKPVVLRKVMIFYNMTCSILSLYTLAGFLIGIYQSDFVYERATYPLLTHIFLVYYLVKNIELLDTVFMVIRHKRRQISFLHVYHHSSMLLLSEYAFRFSAWPAIAPILMLNSLVHVFLYLYYGLTALNPSNPPSWKKRLTELQIIQFYVDLIYAFYGYLYHQFCVYGFMYGFLMIYLFSNFYYHAYLRKRPSKEIKDQPNGKKLD